MKVTVTLEGDCDKRKSTLKVVHVQVISVGCACIAQIAKPDYSQLLMMAHWLQLLTS